MIIAKRTGTNFDVLGIEETASSISRNKDAIQISWVNESGQLERYKKTTPQTLTLGSHLCLSQSYLKGTGDKNSAVAILLSDFNSNAETKIINGKTAYLLPIFVI